MHDTGRIVLDPRLSMIAHLVGPCECCADIGCDHGRLGASMLQTGQVRRMVLTDISEPSLAKARKLIGQLGLKDRVEFAVCDGALALAHPVDAAVIAGMGGATIARIVLEGRRALGDARLILEANVAAPQLRSTLSECGYELYDERVARDGRRNYVILCARPGRAEYTERELIVGPVLLRRLPEELKPYALFRLRVAKKALAGAEISGDAAQTKPLAREIEIWEEVLACLQR